MKSINKGFTLAELLVVVGVIAVLVSIAVPVFTGQLEKTREATDLANIRGAYAEVIMTASDDFEMEIDLKQAEDDWQTSGAQATLERLGNVEGVPAGKGKCTVTFSTSTQKITFIFDGESSDEPEGYVFGDNRRSRMTTMAQVIYDALKDQDPNLINAFISGSAGTANFFTGTEDAESFKYREIWLNESGLNSFSQKRYYQNASGGSTAYNVNDLIGELGVDYSDFYDSDYVGNYSVIYFDTETNEPLAVSYFKEGSTNDYRIVFSDGTAYKYTTSNGNYMVDGKVYNRQYYVYHKDIAAQHLTPVGEGE